MLCKTAQFPPIKEGNGHRIDMIFVSRKNHVELKDSKVVKKYTEPECLKREARMLRQLNLMGVKVPEIIEETEDALTLEYINGPTYSDIIDELNAEQAQALAAHLAEFYKATATLRGDVNLRNFIYNNGVCYGLDFEDPPQFGDIEQDMGRILAFAVTYDPMLSIKKRFAAKHLLAAFLATGADIEKLKATYLKEIDAMETRRGEYFTQGEKARNFWSEIVT